MSDDGATSVLNGGRQAYVAVRGKAGPHVTPELYAWSADRLWFLAASSTLKAKVLPERATAAAVVLAEGRAVALHGIVQTYDPAKPATIRLAGADTVRALAGYVTRNASDLLAFGRDLATGRLGRRLPPRRVLFALAPDGVEPVDVPAGDGEPAVVALESPSGLRARPARWHAERAEVTVGPAVLTDLGAGEGDELAVAVVVDAYRAPGPAAKEGRLVRGSATVGPGATLRVEVDRAVRWEGVDTVREA